MYILHNLFLPPATKLGQGNLFRSVCQEFCSRGSGRVSRPTPGGGRLGGSGWGEVSRPTPRGELGSLARGGLQAHTQGEGWRVWPGGLQAHTWGGWGGGVWWGVSRPTPGGGCRLGCLAGRSPGPHSGGRLGGLAGGLQAHTWGGGVGRLGICPVGLQDHTQGVSRPTPGGVSQHALRQTPPPPKADGYCCGWYVSYWNAFLLYFTNSA